MFGLDKSTVNCDAVAFGLQSHQPRTSTKTIHAHPLPSVPFSTTLLTSHGRPASLPEPPVTCELAVLSCLGRASSTIGGVGSCFALGSGVNLLGGEMIPGLAAETPSRVTVFPATGLVDSLSVLSTDRAGEAGLVFSKTSKGETKSNIDFFGGAAT